MVVRTIIPNQTQWLFSTLAFLEQQFVCYRLLMANAACIVLSLFPLASYTFLRWRHGEPGYVWLGHVQKEPETLKQVLMFMNFGQVAATFGIYTDHFETSRQPYHIGILANSAHEIRLLEQ